MDTVTKWRTIDGTLHDSEGAARKYADEVMGAELCRHATKLAVMGKYTEILEYLERHLGDLSCAYKWQLEATMPLHIDTEEQ